MAALVMLKCESRVKLVHMQYNISDSQALFWCSALIILEMASLDRHFVIMSCETGSLALFLACA